MGYRYSIYKLLSSKLFSSDVVSSFELKSLKALILERGSMNTYPNSSSSEIVPNSFLSSCLFTKIQKQSGLLYTLPFVLSFNVSFTISTYFLETLISFLCYRWNYIKNDYAFHDP
jgi:hypothetical protein